MSVTPEDWPEALGTYLGINELTAAMILSVVVISAIVFPVMLLTRKEQGSTRIWLIFAFIAEVIVLGLGWLPLWVMIMTILITSLSIAREGSNFLGG